jgi:hypothetical protein
MTYIPYNIPVPDFIARICVWFLLRWRKWKYGYPFRKIKLTQNKYAIVDVDGFEELNKYKWFALKSINSFYARRTIYINGKYKAVHMHRTVLKYDGELFVDHINGNGLDNRKDNLRLVTAAQNSYNVGKTTRPCSSKYRGVCRAKKSNKWYAYISLNRKRTHLGFYDDEIEAAKAYDRVAKELYGKYAKLNFE